MIPDQTVLWNKKHAEGDHAGFRNQPSTLATLASPMIKPSSKILNLGCGNGRDDNYFAQQGHFITATDVSPTVIEQNEQLIRDKNISFVVMDMQHKLPYSDASFDVVFSSLSIHYFSHAKTAEIITEVRRVLKAGGLFIFSCKSINDFHHGNGEEIEDNLFVSDKGHVRHLFSLDYTKSLLDDFVIKHLKEVTEVYSGEASVMIQCAAQKP